MGDLIFWHTTWSVHSVFNQIQNPDRTLMQKLNKFTSSQIFSSPSEEIRNRNIRALEIATTCYGVERVPMWSKVIFCYSVTGRYHIDLKVGLTGRIIGQFLHFILTGN